MSKQVIVTTIPPCDLSQDHGPAYADARIPAVGSWAYLCQACFTKYGCTLGTGHGQHLIKKEDYT